MSYITSAQEIFLKLREKKIVTEMETYRLGGGDPMYTVVPCEGVFAFPFFPLERCIKM